MNIFIKQEPTGILLIINQKTDMRTLFTLILCIFVYSGAVQAQSMSDEQIIQYVQQAQLSGKSQQQMATELAAKGVTPEQMQRLRINMKRVSINRH